MYKPGSNVQTMARVWEQVEVHWVPHALLPNSNPVRNEFCEAPCTIEPSHRQWPSPSVMGSLCKGVYIIPKYRANLILYVL